MSDARRVIAALETLGARKLDGSARGSGLNAVWAIRVGVHPAILKTYSSRRSPVQTVLNDLGHRLSGRTGYTARARQETERRNLLLWQQAGFDVPGLLPLPEALEFPLPVLCMEYVEGPTLSAFLADAAVPPERKEQVFVRFLSQWGERLGRAERERQPRLVQEHGTLEHVLVSADRLVTFDLEVSFTRAARVRDCIDAEICGYLRSLLKRQAPAVGARLLELLVRNYPHRHHLDSVYADLFRSPRPVSRLVHALDRRFLRKAGNVDKYRAAERLDEALQARQDRSPAGVRSREN